MSWNPFKKEPKLTTPEEVMAYFEKLKPTYPRRTWGWCPLCSFERSGMVSSEDQEAAVEKNLNRLCPHCEKKVTAMKPILKEIIREVINENKP